MLFKDIALKKKETEGFSFRFLYNSAGETSLGIQCSDREDNLIDGLVHEITEASIELLCPEVRGKTISLFVAGVEYTYKLQHVATLLSLPLYEMQRKYLFYLLAFLETFS